MLLRGKASAERERDRAERAGEKSRERSATRLFKVTKQAAKRTRTQSAHTPGHTHTSDTSRECDEHRAETRDLALSDVLPDGADDKA